MPFYKYKHNCGIGEQEFFLKEVVETKIIDCYGCGRKVTARQVRDPSTKIVGDDELRGEIKMEPKQ